MYQPLLVGLRERAADLKQDRNHTCRWLASKVLDQILNRDAVNVLHHIKKGVVGRATVVIDRDRVGMPQPSGQSHFPFESSQRVFVDVLTFEHFDGDFSFEHIVRAAVDRSHPAATDQLRQFVLAKSTLATIDQRDSSGPMTPKRTESPCAQRGRQGNQQQHQACDTEIANRPVRFPSRDFGHQIHFVIRQPFPCAHDFDATIARIGRRSFAHPLTRTLDRDFGPLPSRPVLFAPLIWRKI